MKAIHPGHTHYNASHSSFFFSGGFCCQLLTVTELICSCGLRIERIIIQVTESPTRTPFHFPQAPHYISPSVPKASSYAKFNIFKKFAVVKLCNRIVDILEIGVSHLTNVQICYIMYLYGQFKNEGETEVKKVADR